jgi:chemotaxis protein methyltransferase CheR
MSTVAFDTEPALTDRDMTRIVKLVYEHSGITLHDGKKALVVARLQKRLRTLGLSSFGAYMTHVEGDASGAELSALLDAIATNHTSFFREDQHFRFLEQRAAAAGGGPLKVWSAACSTGEEPYSIAMTLDRVEPRPAFSILASDISTKALATARAGVYKMATVQSLSLDTLRRYFQKGMGKQEGLARIAPDVQRGVEFRHMNLLEIGDLGTRFDVIFCRNVMIYFDIPVQQRVVTMLERHLRPGGHLLISHSESLNGVKHQMQWVAPAIYQRGPA